MGEGQDCLMSYAVSVLSALFCVYTTHVSGVNFSSLNFGIHIDDQDGCQNQ